MATGVGLSAWRAPQFVAPAADSLVDGETCDLAIVGGGFLGLSTALHAARRGLSVRVIEARALGEGASGLNGGQVIPGLKFDPEWLVAHYGEKAGEALVSFVSSTADTVFDLIRSERLDVPHRRAGWIFAAHTAKALAAAADRHRQWSSRGADAELLDAAAIGTLTGASGYRGGWLDRRAGVVQPLALTFGLARVAQAAGARIATGTQVTRLSRREGHWRVDTASGATVKAARVLVATNAYSDGLIPGLAQSLVWLNSFQIATPPLPDGLGAGVLPGGQAVSDSRRILIYYRRGPDGRLIVGGRGGMPTPKRPADWAHLERAMARLFPALAGFPIERRWFGRVAMTADHLPHIHTPEEGLVAVAGCQGRGVGLMTALGPRMAAYFAEGDREALPFPPSPIRPIPFHRFRRVGVAATLAWYRLLDRLER
ncbi:MAG TPA: FAD-binding oxidoreductase [Rhizobiales bacterium]|nr:FAD-binding oxidoreductase [Hyphomicrobiales bacterium]